MQFRLSITELRQYLHAKFWGELHTRLQQLNMTKEGEKQPAEEGYRSF